MLIKFLNISYNPVEASPLISPPTITTGVTAPELTNILNATPMTPIINGILTENLVKKVEHVDNKVNSMENKLDRVLIERGEC